MYAYLIEGRTAEGREEFDQAIYAVPGYNEAVQRLNLSVRGIA